MSVWDFDEYGNPYPSEERPDYDDNLYDNSDDYNNAAHNHHRHLDEEEEHHHHHLTHHDNQDEAFLFSDDNGEPSHSHHSGSHAAHAAHHDHQHDGHHHPSPAAHHVHSHYEQQQPSQQLHHMYEDHGNSSQNFDTVGNANDSTQHTSSPQQQQHSRNEDLFGSSRVMQLNLDEIDTLATSHRSKPWLVVLYAPWCTHCQAMEPAFNMVAQRLQHSDVFVAKFQADGDNKPYAKQYLQLESFPTILFFPANSSSVVKYQSEDREAIPVSNKGKISPGSLCLEQGSTLRTLWLQALYTQGATGEHPQGYWPGDKHLKSQTSSR
ncbi:hypothetical protein BDL97_02G007300 [Sphagnum fallax]|nr:hypothetical protein BDL97_02G007300 [Sphagnum fallax]